MTRGITILGATGSIGVSTLDVVARHPDRYRVHALTANSNLTKLAEQCQQFNPAYAVVADENNAAALKELLSGSDTQVLAGVDGLCEVASADPVDMVMAAIVGAAGLLPTLAAVKAGKTMLLANKESLVMSGDLFMQAVRENDVTLLPIDSEHNAIYQCLANGAETHNGGVRKLLLTASGGPLLRTPQDELASITPQQACAHPNWSMGRKISVDSASMMNKGLELIEASLLFAMSPSLVEVVIHPQSIVHSMVEYVDGSVIAQMGNPDMRTPIAHGLAWPDRIESGVPGLDVTRMGDLSFEAADTDQFPCLRLCQEAAGKDQVFRIALNAANEIAVDQFLSELIPFTAIPVIIEAVLAGTAGTEVHTIEDVVAADAEARREAARHVERLRRA